MAVSTAPVNVVPPAAWAWSANDGEGTDGGVCGKEMRRLALPAAKATLWVLPSQNLVDRAAKRAVNNASGTNKIGAPLLVVGVEDDAERAETLESPVEQPWLARILADVARWKALRKVSDEKLEMLLSLEGRRRRWIERKMFEEDRLSFSLGIRRISNKLVVGRWARFGHEDVAQSQPRFGLLQQLQNSLDQTNSTDWLRNLVGHKNVLITHNFTQKTIRQCLLVTGRSRSVKSLPSV